MEQVKIANITQKTTRPADKTGYIEVKYRTYFNNPLTNKRREILSDWYTIVNKKDTTGKIKLSPQIKAIIHKELQEKANKVYEELTRTILLEKSDITLDKVWNEWHNERVERQLVAPKTLAGEDGRYRNHITKQIPKDSILKNIPSSLIKNLLDNLYPIGNHKRLAQGVKSDLTSIYKFAILHDYISPDQNPMPYISIGRKGLSNELDRLKKSDIEDQYLESWELK